MRSRTTAELALERATFVVPQKGGTLFEPLRRGRRVDGEWCANDLGEIARTAGIASVQMLKG